MNGGTAGSCGPSSLETIDPNAGHPPGLLLRGGKLMELGSDNMVLGVDPNENYKQSVIDLQSGDSLLLYTDGLTDAANFSNQRYGRQRLNQSTADHGFEMTDATNAGAPTVMKAQVVLKPGETKYIGIPTSDMFYATQGNTLTYRCHLHPGHVGGKILMLK